jgi:glutamine synthetase
MGFIVNCGIEAEFYVLQDTDVGHTSMTPRHELEKPAYDVVRLLDNLDTWLGEMVAAMN